MSSEPVSKNASYDDIRRLPPGVTGEILAGELYVQPRPASYHAFVASGLGADLVSAFQRGRGGPGGWFILDEPELHLGDDVVVPDLAGWRRERLTEIPDEPYLTLAPDWVCEVISPRTARKDRTVKLSKGRGMLVDVSAHLNLEHFGKAYGSDFDFRGRHICNYINRKIRPLRFKSEGFWSVAVRGCKPSTVHSCRISPTGVLRIDVDFDQTTYDGMDPLESQEFYLDMLERGLGAAREAYDLPYEQLLQAMNDFREGGNVNEWEHCTQFFRGFRGLRGRLKCSMDAERFALRLQLERKGVVLYDEEVLEAKPDELCFAHKFEDMEILGETLVVTARVSKPLMELDLRPFL